MARNKKLSTGECLGMKLRSWRKEKGYLLKRVAKDLNVCVAVVAQRETAIRFPTHSNLDQIADYMDLEGWELFYVDKKQQESIMAKKKQLTTAECVGNKLRTWRKEQGYPIKRIAKHLKVSISVVSQWERALRFPSIKNIDQIAEYMGVEVWELFYADELGLEE